MAQECTLKSFDAVLGEDLRDPEFASIYLQANGGMAQCAEKANVFREVLYRMLWTMGYLELRSILPAYGLRV